MQKQLNKAIAMDLLSPHLTQQEIADQHGCSQTVVSRYQKELLCKIPELGKMHNDELQAADLDFLIDYKNFIENDLFLYNILFSFSLLACYFTCSICTN